MQLIQFDLGLITILGSNVITKGYLDECASMWILRARFNNYTQMNLVRTLLEIYQIQIHL